jgi:hypothetical protein
MYTGHIARTEWRWLFVVSLTLILMAFVPFLAVALRSDANSDWRFMGTLHQYHISVAYLVRMEQGSLGNWLTHFQYTPEPHASALIQPLYVLLGQLSRFTILSSTIVFHVARLGAALFMYAALYQLAASIWVRVRTRRIFFVIASVGSGFGWLLALLTGEVYTPDLTLAHLYPFFAMLVSVHYPLTIACLSLLAAVFIIVFRPGVTDSPSVQNTGVLVVILSLVLIFLYPETLLPFGSAVAISVLLHGYQTRQYPEREIRWGLWLLIPATPILAYYFITLRNNPVVAEWVQQKARLAPDPLMLVIGLGLPLLIALPGILRAARRLERDGDRFMVLWLAAMLLWTYLPLDIHSETLAGFMLPIAYFAARAMEDVWLERLRRGMRRWAYILAVPILATSHLFTLLVPIASLLVTNRETTGMVLEVDYLQTFKWLKPRTAQDDVVLASPNDVSAWLPYWTETRVVYGHPYETQAADQQLAAARQWYRTTDPQDPICTRLLNTDNYRVRYVLWGPREQLYGGGACLENLELVIEIGRVQVYRLRVDF